MPAIVLIRGAGDLATGIALRLHRVGINVVMTELHQPLAVRRTVAFAEALFEGESNVEGVIGRKVKDPADLLTILNVLGGHKIPVLADPDCVGATHLHPLVIIDARMKKQPPESLQHSALLYIGIGPGFSAPANCHAVIETQRGHTMGRVIWKGTAREDSTRPEGDHRRVLRAPDNGVLESDAHIGQRFEQGALIAMVAAAEIKAPFSGTLRGLLRPGMPVEKGLKIGDIDERDDPQLCTLVSDKSLAVGGGVLEAMLARPEVRSRLWA